MYVTLDLKHSLKEQISNSVPAANQLNTSYIHRETVENSSRDGNTRPPDLPIEKPVFSPESKS